MDTSLSACVSVRRASGATDTATMPADVCLRFLREVERVHAAGLKSYGLLVAEPDAPGWPLRATDVVFLESSCNRRNESGHRAAFEAQGTYFRRYEDAGFVADSGDLLRAYRRIEESGQEIVGLFHSHRRQPPNFSWIDFRLHNPAFPWHLIVSFHRGPVPRLQPFRIRKEGVEMGISAQDRREGSERSYPGPEVRPLCLVVDGSAAAVDECTAALGRGVHPVSR